MDITTLLGIVSGALLILYGMGVGNLGHFVDIPGVAITVGGTFAVIIASYPVSTLKGIPKHFKIVTSGRKHNPIDYINSISEYAQIARKNGLLALEERAHQQKDPFLRNSLLLIVDAIDPDKVKKMLEDDIAHLEARHQESASIYEKGGTYAPAFGMIGTLMGLVNMLNGMDFSSGSASDQLGKGMSLALLTTFYGCVLANLVYFPIANKLMARHEEEVLCKAIIIEGVLSIQSGENPKFIREKLISFLPQKEREMALRTGKGDYEGSTGSQPQNRRGR